MNNFIQHGKTLTATLAAAVVSGAAVTLGNSKLPAVASGTYAANTPGEYAVTGVFELPADAAAAGAVGDAAYLTPAGTIATVSDGNTAYGVLAASVAANSATARVRLPGA
ncbi:capsid cement protein [Paraburkholderia tropica]|uniref:capsid cement protein n=1 Tax=Paraburkholderia tropica TaxID=92647 RepID=UPI002AB6A6C3|nr:capsid cement protein [Paraburkholderia tropica]